MHASTSDNQPAIHFDGVSKTFRDGAVEALRNITLSVSRGKILGLIGPNGAGKTTFLRILLGLLQPSAGRVQAAADLARGSSNVACVLDSDGVYIDLTPRANFEFFGALYGLSAGESSRRGLEFLEQFGLLGKAASPIKNLSKGQKKIVSLCRAMIMQPRLLVVDELTANLDPGNQRRMINFIHDLHASQGTTIIFSSHDLHSVEEVIDHIVLLSEGEKRLDCNVANAADYVSYRIDCDQRSALKTVQRVLEQRGIPSFQSGLTTVRAVVSEAAHAQAALGELKVACQGICIEQVAATLEDLYHTSV